jgi:integrase
MLSLPASEKRYPPALRKPDLSGRTRVRSAETVAAYRKRYAGLLARAQKATGRGDMDLNDFAIFVRSLAPELRHSSYRQYAAAFNQLIRDAFDRGSIDFDEAEALAEILILDEPASEVCKAPASSPRTSARRAKSISLAETAEISASLAGSLSRYAEAVSALLVVNQLLGLRPTEWLDAEIEGTDLVVKCAKFSTENGRGIADYRVISLQAGGFSRNQIIVIDQLIHTLKQMVKAAGGDRQRVVRRLARALQDHRPVGSRVTLRSSRHQAKSNFVASGLAPAEIAALMGHISASTAQQHYGARGRGRRIRNVVRADPRLVARVKSGAWLQSKTGRVGLSGNAANLGPDKFAKYPRPENDRSQSRHHVPGFLS